MGFLVNFGIGLGNSMNKGFQAAEEKRAEMVKYRLGVLEKEKDSYTAAKSKASALDQQATALSAQSNIPKADILAALAGGGITAADIAQGKYQKVGEAVSNMKPAQPVQKTQAETSSAAPDFMKPMQKPDATPNLGQSVQAPQVTGAAPQVVPDQRDTVAAAQASSDVRVGGNTAFDTGQDSQFPDTEYSPPEQQSTMAWAGNKLKQGLFGRDPVGGASEADAMFMKANGLTPEQFQAMREYTTPTYAGTGQRYSYDTSTKVDMGKMVMAAKLEDILPGHEAAFAQAASSQDWPGAMSHLRKTEEKDQFDRDTRVQMANIAAAAHKQAGTNARQPTAVQNAHAWASMPEGPEKEALGKILFQMKDTPVDQRFDAADLKPLGLGESEADRAMGKLRIIQREESNGKSVASPEYKAQLRKEAGLE